MHDPIRSLLLATTFLLLATPGQVPAQEPENGSEPKPKANRLIDESSPYLRQHAHNPIDWYPWSDEAFARAEKEDKMVFLSIGYSTCHWCHVMERESFENEAIAKILNERFVSVKVDREERPDVDAIYMAAVQALSGRGGWPLTVFLMPDGKPIWGTTYLPPVARGGRPGLTEVLHEIDLLWREDRERVRSGSKQLLEAVDRLAERAAAGGEGIGSETIDALFTRLKGMHDPVHGGFGNAPKFPRPHEITACLARWKATGDEETLAMAERTLDAMAAGGLQDHLGGGFHRYSTDPIWLVPHFEKMLYDQALLTIAYIDAYRATGRKRHLDVAMQTIDYVLRELADPAGGFHSAEDADSEGAEGTFYVWNFEEVASLLSKEEMDVATAYFGLEPKGNFLDATSHEGGIPHETNILHVAKPLSEVAKVLQLDLDETSRRLESARSKLRTLREQRIRPHKDDKVLTGWNGLFLSALARAFQASGEDRLGVTARRLARFLVDTMIVDGRLLRRYRAGEAGIPAYLDDHAFLALGLIDLYEATFEVEWLTAARTLITEFDRLFHDDERGGYFLTASDNETLVSRTKPLYDGAIPSGNSAATLAIGRMARMTGDPELEERFEQTLKTFSKAIAESPVSYPFFLAAASLSLGPSYEVVLAGDSTAVAPLARALRRGYHPNLVLLHHPPGDAGADIRALAPFLEGQEAPEGQGLAYVCQDFSCQEPTTEVEKMLKMLGSP